MKLKRADIAKARTLQQLQELAKSAGYSFGWAEAIYRARMRKK
jgi:hypothetical protein